MKIKILASSLLFSLILLTSCEKRYSVNDLFSMEDCTGPCYQRMGCEGQRITVEFKLNGSNILQNGHMFFVRDEEDMNKTIKVEFDKSIPEDVRAQLINNVGQTALVTGHIEGYDLLNTQSCRRAHIIYVSNAEDLRFE